MICSLAQLRLHGCCCPLGDPEIINPRGGSWRPADVEGGLFAEARGWTDGIADQDDEQEEQMIEEDDTEEEGLDEDEEGRDKGEEGEEDEDGNRR